VGATQFTLFMAINNSGYSIGSGLVGILTENMDWNYIFICIAAVPLCCIPFIKMLNFEKHSLKINTFN
jgi:PAT family beta-lactamase induction signal transducer AmpG